MNVSDLVRYGIAGLGHVSSRLVLGKTKPLVGGIAINDRCNLSCRHCAVSNRNIPDMDISEIRAGLKILRKMKIETLFIEGGEPFLWSDGAMNLETVVGEAKSKGFRSVIVYTNGTFPIETSATTVYVSLDGMKDTNDLLRGRCFETAVSHIERSNHPKILINFTINAVNEREIESFCDLITQLRSVKGLFFYFHTPYDESDALSLDARSRSRVVDRLLKLKRLGYPVLNSNAALKAVAKNSWRRPSRLCYLYANNTLYRCCRAFGNERMCASCGYLGYVELHCISTLRPSAIAAAVKCL